MDASERELPSIGRIVFEDAETGELLELDSSRAAVRRQFADTNTARLGDLEVRVHRGVDERLDPLRSAWATKVVSWSETTP